MSEGHALVPVKKNLVDALWEDRPTRPVNPVMVQPLKWTGICILFLFFLNFICICIFIFLFLLPECSKFPHL